MQTPSERLSEFMEARRLVLGMKTWRDLAAQADISYETLRTLRAGGSPSPATAHQLEDVLQWATGSIRAILDGGEPKSTRVVQGKATTNLGFTASARGVVTKRRIDFGLGDEPPYKRPRGEAQIAQNTMWKIAKQMEATMIAQHEAAEQEERDAG